MTNRRKFNEITCIETQSSKLARVYEIKQKIFNYFSEVFKNCKIMRPILEDFEFKGIGTNDNVSLTYEYGGRD